MKLHAAVHAEILGAFCLAFGMVLAVTDHMTEGDIATRAMEDKQNSLTQVIPTALHDNNPASDTVSVKDADGTATVAYRARINGQVTAVAYEIHGTGYAGDIRLVMGVDAAGHLLGVRVLAHKETPGLGDRIEEKKSDWIRRFTGLSLGHPPTDRWKVKKDGGDFDQFAGATITPRGVVTAVHRGLDFFSAHKTQLLGTS